MLFATTCAERRMQSLRIAARCGSTKPTRIVPSITGIPSAAQSGNAAAEDIQSKECTT